MKTIRASLLCLSILLLAAPLMRARDLSKYRGFSLGSRLATVLKLTDKKLPDVNAAHGVPVLVQELTWWPPNIPAASYTADSVEQIFFSFYDGALYKISVTYDQGSTEGLTAEDMVKSVSAKYGSPSMVMPEFDAAAKNRYEVREYLIAMWEDSLYSFSLVRSSLTDRFGLIIYSKQVNEQAQLAIAEAVKLEEQEGPRREAERQKKRIDDLEAARHKNQKSFRP
jgi:hypothetical protein